MVIGRRSHVVALLVALALLLPTGMLVSTPALAAPSDVSTVQGVSPRGTTINLFDYWVTGKTDADNQQWSSMEESAREQGIKQPTPETTLKTNFVR